MILYTYRPGSNTEIDRFGQAHYTVHAKSNIIVLIITFTSTITISITITIASTIAITIIISITILRL